MSARALVRLVAMMLVAGACTVSSSEVVGEGTDLDVTAALASHSSLQGLVEFTTTARTRPIITVLDGDGNGFEVTSPELGPGEHTVPIIGLLPETEYTIEVGEHGLAGSDILTTGSLPDDLPPIDLIVSEPDRMSPGLTLFDAIPLPGETSEATADGYLLAVDAEGRVVWYYRQTHSIQDVRRTGDGNLLFIHHETGARLLDPADNTMVEWSGTAGLETASKDEFGRLYAGPEAIPVDTEQMHHEVIELPNGNLMTLSREIRTVEGYPDPLCDDNEDFDGSYEVVADTVVEFVPETGEVVREWSLFDLADPLADLDRIRPSEFCSAYLSPVYPDLPARDWTHANAVVFDAARNAVLVSVRHLDQVFAIRYADDESGPAGELLWRFGENGDFTLEDGEWFLHQHSPHVLDDGSIMIYDNGNERPGTSLDDPDRLPYSRAVRYELDVESLTARQVWQHRLDTPGKAVYAPFVGDADLLSGNTVLITHGGQLDPPAHTPQQEGVTAWGQVVEVDYDSGEVIFDLRIKDPDLEDSWIIYRAERIGSLMPAGFSVAPVEG
ncbi:MAG: aryl-sulfate sulfotransferase [Acidimicrobiia bacterium]